MFSFGAKKETGGQNHDFGSRATGTASDAVDGTRAVYLCTISHNSRLGGIYTLFAGSTRERSEWKAKLEEAIGLRKFVSNPIFKMKTLSADTFLVRAPPAKVGPSSSWSNNVNFTGKVTCSVPFGRLP